MGAAPLLRSEFWARRGSWADFLLHPPSSLPYTLYSGGRAQCHCFPAPQGQQAGWGPRCTEGSLSSPATLRKASSSSPLRIPPRPALSCPHKQLYSFAASNLHYVMHGSFNMYQANLKMVLKYLGFRAGRRHHHRRGFCRKRDRQSRRASHPEEWGRPHPQEHTAHPQTLRRTPGACSRPSPWGRCPQDPAPGWTPRCRGARRAPQHPRPAHTAVSPSMQARVEKPRGGRRRLWVKSPLWDLTA